MSKHSKRKVSVVLIKSSKYDDDGYVIRHFRGVLPSNTLACLYSLTEAVKRSGSLGEAIDLRVRLFDDSVQSIPVDKIVRSNRLPDRRTIVALVGVQSNQYPRAADLARRFRAGGLQVLIGGFHVSGTLALFDHVTPEIQELLDLGVTVVKGEVEDHWGKILQDAIGDRLQPMYDFLKDLPDLYERPLPMIHRRYLRRFITSNFGTIDCSRGCPFYCSFCSIINVQGRKMRHRSPEALAEALRENYRRHKINFYFFTDDNFARNPGWRENFSMLERLRNEEKIPIQFMIQVDTQSHKIPDFIKLAARAGCTQVFIGMESINPKNLKAAAKPQNHVNEYKDLIAAWHEARVATHVGYIIGFPFDTPESVAEDVERLKSELGVEQASFFMLTPLPGSRDHVQAVKSGEYMDSDLNRYDSFHETTHHPNFGPGEWYTTYRKAWRSFYSFEYMKQVLSKANPENYWNIFRNFIWYKNAALIEEGHPMVHGFFRLKSRRDRRAGYQVESRLAHFLGRFRELRHLSREWISFALEMEELWLQTRKRSDAELLLLGELQRIRERVGRNLHAAEVQLAIARAKARCPELLVPSRVALVFRDLNTDLAKRLTYSRADLQQFWNRMWRRWRRHQIFWIPPHKVALNFLRDMRLLLMFAAALIRAEV
jgi:radical SAM superfamily enzyme YgiQ (UPF0313 family)